MGGGGSVSAMIQSLKNNAALQKKSNFYKFRRRFKKVSKNFKIDYKKATKEELLAIRQEVRRKNKVKQKVDIVLYSLLGLLLIWWMVLWF